ncbi:MAG: ferrous iron transport protein B [Thermoprotei archaeon]|nr:MAG: ferrous iron transport protein B [Thermoprotei archaeon]
MSKEITIAVMGQPNVGKSTLFNVLTGRNVHVANWPGVTVERHEGWRDYRNRRLHFVDLPGIYGLSASTLEEVIARSYLVSGGPDVVLVLVDSTIPERTMYLALEVLELFPKTIIVLTKSDLAHPQGIHINPHVIERKLGVPVVMVSAATGQGVNELLETIVRVSESIIGRRNPLKIDYDELEPFIRSVEEIVSKTSLAKDFPIRWAAIRLLEGDIDLESRLRKRGEEEALRKIAGIREEIRSILRQRPEEVFAQKRFNYLMDIVRESIARIEKTKMGVHERFDKIIMHPIMGPIISFLILLILFTVVFTINTGFPFNILLDSMGLSDAASIVEEYSLAGLMDKAISLLGEYIAYTLEGSPEWFVSLVVDGIIGGVGAVLVFLPLIFLIALMLAILEDSGLAPRIAVSLNYLLNKIGLSGHAVFPMTLSLGCNVPAVMATRATPNYRERIRLILTIPFIPCQARLIVILAFASALTGLGSVALVLFSYIGAFLVFAFISKLLITYDRRKGLYEEPELLLEIPPLHKPLPKVIWWLTWDSVRHFLKKAGTIIFLVTVIAWAMLYYAPSLEPAVEPGDSIGAGIAKIFAPLLYPLGLNYDQAWMIAYALIIGFLAKEAVVGTLAILAGTSSASEAIRVIGLSDPQIAGLTMFSVLYVPCLATLAVIYSESRNLKLTLIAIAIMLSVAYLVSLVTYSIIALFS